MNNTHFEHLLSKITPELIESCGYRIIDNNNLAWRCGEKEVCWKYCHEHCDKYDSCSEIAAEEDAIKLLNGEDILDYEDFECRLNNIGLEISDLEI